MSTGYSGETTLWLHMQDIISNYFVLSNHARQAHIHLFPLLSAIPTSPNPVNNLWTESSPTPHFSHTQMYITIQKKRSVASSVSSQCSFTLKCVLFCLFNESFPWPHSYLRAPQDIRPMRDQIVRVKRFEKVPLILVGNKVDLESEREVAGSDGRALAQEWGCPFIETSAKSKSMVDELFAEIVRQMNYTTLPEKQEQCCTACVVQWASRPYFHSRYERVWAKQTNIRVF